MTERSLLLSVERRLPEVARVNEQIAAFLGDSVSGDLSLDVLLCVEEVLSNIIRHGGDGQTPILLRAGISTEELEIHVEDDGPAFNPLAYPAPALDRPLQERRPGGLGIFLVKRLMDISKYERSQDRNCFTMIKQLPNSPRREAGGQAG